MRLLKEAMEALTKMLAPFTPHIAEELWAHLGHNEIAATAAWPDYDAELAKAEELEIPVQLNGKLIARLVVPAEASDEELKAQLHNALLEYRKAHKGPIPAFVGESIAVEDIVIGGKG